MWKLILTLGLVALTSAQGQGRQGQQGQQGRQGQQGQQGQGGQGGQQQFNSQCLSTFDRSFRQCFKTNGNFDLDVIFSLITNGTSGPLPQGTNRQQAIKQLCSVREAQNTCTKPIPAGMVGNKQMACKPNEKGMMESTVMSTERAIAGLCGVQPEMPACLAKFDTKFRACMTQNQIVPDQYFKFLANSTDGLQMSFNQLNQTICSRKQIVLQCASASLQQLSSECTKEETFMVGQTLQNMMGTFQALCTGRPPPPPPGAIHPCLQKFEVGLDKCAMDNTGLKMMDLMNLLTRGIVPAGKTNDQLNQTICSNSKKLEQCGKKAVQAAGCKGREMLIAEGSFANMFITTGAYCRDTSMPGACMLTMQSQFTKCFGEVGLKQDDYTGDVSSHKGALIGTTRASAQAYCGKRQELYACMKKVMHRCPGAEQTMTLTGFDLSSMERAVSTLCGDIDEYLAGLSCFETPSAQSMKCIDDMGQAVTSMSAKEMAKGLSLKSFFNTFCDIRIKHVTCDANAWPTCENKAVQLKRKFECHLLPSSCHEMYADQLDQICPENAKVKPHLCIDDMRGNLGQCISKYGIDPEVFLVNVTHDRTNILGNRANADNFCQKRNEVFSCMHMTLDTCLGAIELLEKWGHQQNQLENAINMACDDLNSYEASLQCLPASRANIQACVTRTENSIQSLSQKMPSAAYYKKFCAIRFEQLQCDLNAMKSACPKSAMGFKTEFECSLVQDRCHASHAAALREVCKPSNYYKAERQSAGPPTKFNNNNNGGAKDTQKDNGSSGLQSMSILGSLGIAITTVILAML